MGQITLAEALLRRKELQAKVTVLSQINKQELFEVKGRRQKVTDEVDDLVLQVPMLSAAEVTAEFDWHARQLRLVDAAIQQANWTTRVDLPDTVMQDYAATTPKRGEVKNTALPTVAGGRVV